MPSKIPITTLRIKDPDYSKIKIIAEQNKRSVSKEIEYIGKQHIAAYNKIQKYQLPTTTWGSVVVLPHVRNCPGL